MNGENFETDLPEFQLAIGLGVQTKAVPLNDESFLEWVVMYRVRGSDSENDPQPREVKMHRCTDAEYAKFFEPGEQFSQEVATMNKLGGLYCVDWAALNFELFGVGGMAKFSSLNIGAIPCHLSKHAEEKASQAGKSCNTD